MGWKLHAIMSMHPRTSSSSHTPLQLASASQLVWNRNRPRARSHTPALVHRTRTIANATFVQVSEAGVDVVRQCHPCPQGASQLRRASQSQFTVHPQSDRVQPQHAAFVHRFRGRCRTRRCHPCRRRHAHTQRRLRRRTHSQCAKLSRSLTARRRRRCPHSRRSKSQVIHPHTVMSMHPEDCRRTIVARWHPHITHRTRPSVVQTPTQSSVFRPHRRCKRPSEATSSSASTASAATRNRNRPRGIGIRMPLQSQSRHAVVRVSHTPTSKGAGTAATRPRRRVGPVNPPHTGMSAHIRPWFPLQSQSPAGTGSHPHS